MKSFKISFSGTPDMATSKNTVSFFNTARNKLLVHEALGGVDSRLATVRSGAGRKLFTGTYETYRDQWIIRDPDSMAISGSSLNCHVLVMARSREGCLESMMGLRGHSYGHAARIHNSPQMDVSINQGSCCKSPGSGPIWLYKRPAISETILLLQKGFRVVMYMP